MLNRVDKNTFVSYGYLPVVDGDVVSTELFEKPSGAISYGYDLAKNIGIDDPLVQAKPYTKEISATTLLEYVDDEDLPPIGTTV